MRFKRGGFKTTDSLTQSPTLHISMATEPRQRTGKIRVRTEDFEQFDRTVTGYGVPNLCPECLRGFDYKIDASDVSGAVFEGDEFRGDMCFAGKNAVEYFFVHER